jgi:uncharacterized membrane protein (UPF0127 family)
VRIRNITRGTQLASDAQPARGFVRRLVGLLGRSSLPAGAALVLDPCNSVHTAFMRFPIDVVYVDRGGRVVKAVSNLKPFRVSGVLRGRCSAIELASGTIASTGTAPGDQISFDS